LIIVLFLACAHPMLSYHIINKLFCWYHFLIMRQKIFLIHITVSQIRLMLLSKKKIFRFG